MTGLALSTVLLFFAASARAGLLTAQGVAVLDPTGAARPTFSNTEKVLLQQRVNNAVASANRIQFQFAILSPAGAQVFFHSGNAVPGTVGNAAAQVSGIPISQFFTGPGVYTLKAQATLDGVTLEQRAPFTVSSPNIILIYPPNGARNLSDSPITFRWVSSGASRYRVSVGDNPSLFNSLFSQETAAGESFLSYPLNPVDQRQRLATGQVYYWTVEGLDANGNVVARADVPFSYSIQTVALTRDIAVTEVEVTGAPAAGGAIPFRITVRNQGSSAESNVPLRFGIGGLPAPGTPVNLPMLNPGDTRSYDLPCAIPADQKEGLAIACVELFDDNVPNNCKTVSVTRPPAEAPGGGVDLFKKSQLTAEQAWQAIRELLRQRGLSLDDYNLVGMEGSLTPDDLAAIIDALRSGQAQVTVTGPPIGSVAPPPAPRPVVGGPRLPPGPAPLPAAPPPPAPAPTGQESGAGLGHEWSGVVQPAWVKTFQGVAKDSTGWAKLWGRFNDTDPPKVDFQRNMVVATAAGKEDRADSVEFEDVKVGAAGAVVTYKFNILNRFVPWPSRKSRLPFLMRVVSRTEADVRFELSERGDDDEPKNDR